MFGIYEISVQHHLDRARHWLDNGKPDYALGSYRKAAKWQNKARELDMAINGPFPKNRLDNFVHDMIEFKAKQIADEFERHLFG